MKKLLSAIAAAAALAACSGGSGKSLLPNVSGKAGEVLVVCEKSHWDGDVGAILKDSLMQDCPFLPQREPLYSLVNIPPSAFTQMFQIHRNILLLNINPGVNVPGFVARYNKWAQPQLVLQLNVPSAEDAVDSLKANMHTIISAIETVERDRVVANTRKYCEAKLTKAVSDFVGARMVFPSGWTLKKVNENFFWAAYETTYVQQGVFIYRYPATGKSWELSAKALVGMRNSVLKEEVPGMLEGSYMTTSTILQPAIKYAAYKDLKFAELRGFWDVQGDFMGGPFVSHTCYSPDGEELVCIEAYVYAPKYDKRLYLRQVEALLYSFEWNK